MKILGVVFNRNIIAVLIGLAVIIACVIAAYLFQKNLFGKYRRKVTNTADENGTDQ